LSSGTSAEPPAPVQKPTASPARTAGPSPFQRDTVRKTTAPAPNPPAATTPTGAATATATATAKRSDTNGDWRERIHSALIELDLPFTADGVEHSEVLEQNGELQFVTPKEFSLSMSPADLQKAAQHAAGRPMR